MIRQSAIAAAALLVACGGDEVQPHGSSSGTGAASPGCGPGEVEIESGGCRPAGLPPDMLCAAGELEIDGGCRPAGTDPCARGFEPDGAGACAPIVATSCPKGKMSVPGDAACREVAPCGAAPWGDIPVDASTEYVDAAYQGADSDGSAAKPWKTIQAAIDAAKSGDNVAIAAGSYAESVEVELKAVSLWGRCPSLVEIAGTGAPNTYAAVQIWQAAAGTEVHGLAITGADLAMSISGSQGIVVDRVWIHDTPERGVNVEDTLGTTSVTVSNSLVEDTRLIGVFSRGAGLTVEASEIRGTLPIDGMPGGRGIYLEATAKHRPELAVRGSVVSNNHEIGLSVVAADGTIEGSVVRDTTPGVDGAGIGIAIAADATLGAASTGTVRGSAIQSNVDSGIVVLGSQATIEATLVEDTQPNALDQAHGRGLYTDDQAERSNVTVKTSVFRKNHDSGLFAIGSDLAIESSLVMDTLAQDSDGESGAGVDVEHNAATGQPATLAIHGSVIAHNHDVGVVAQSAAVEIDGTVIRDTQPGLMDTGGDGLAIVPHPDALIRGSLTLTRSVIERNLDMGILLYGADATIESSVVRETQTQLSDQTRGWGILVGDTKITGQGSVATVRWSVIEKSRQIGIPVLGSTLTLEGSAVKDTLPIEADAGAFGEGIHVESSGTFGLRATATVIGSVLERNVGFGIDAAGADVTVEHTRIDATGPLADGRFGDGIGIAALGGPAEVTVSACLITNSARAGISDFGGHLTLGHTTLECNSIDLDGETFDDSAPKFSDGGANVCGCNGAELACAVQSAHLESPAPIPVDSE